MDEDVQRRVLEWEAEQRWLEGQARLSSGAETRRLDEKAPARVPGVALPEFIVLGVSMGLTATLNQPRSEMSAAVRLGDTIYNLPLALYKTWWQARRSQARATLEEWAKKDDIEVAPESLDWFREQGLVVPWPVKSGMVPQFLSRHKILPIGIGIGNSAEAPESYEIITQDMRPVAHLGIFPYSVWSYSDGCRSVWEACEYVAHESGSPTEEVNSHMLATLPLLIEANVAYLDTTERLP